MRLRLLLRGVMSLRRAEPHLFQGHGSSLSERRKLMAASKGSYRTFSGSKSSGPSAAGTVNQSRGPAPL